MVKDPSSNTSYTCVAVHSPLTSTTSPPRLKQDHGSLRNSGVTSFNLDNNVSLERVDDVRSYCRANSLDIQSFRTRPCQPQAAITLTKKRNSLNVASADESAKSRIQYCFKNRPLKFPVHSEPISTMRRTILRSTPGTAVSVKFLGFVDDTKFAP